MEPRTHPLETEAVQVEHAQLLRFLHGGHKLPRTADVFPTRRGAVLSGKHPLATRVFLTEREGGTVRKTHLHDTCFPDTQVRACLENAPLEMPVFPTRSSMELSGKHFFGNIHVGIWEVRNHVN